MTHVVVPPSVLLLLAGILPLPLTAQDQTAAAPSAQGRLDKALAATAACKSLAFKTSESQDAAMTRRFGGMMGGRDRDVSGKWADGLLFASFNDDEDEVITSGVRTRARHGDSAWKLRRGFTLGGAPIPFLLDPGLLVESLRALPEAARKVVHEDKAKVEGKELEVFTLTLDGEAARDLALCGAMPKVSGMGGIIFAGGGPPGMQAAAPDVKVDVAVFADPESGLIHRVRLKGYEEGGMAGNVMIKVAGPGGGEEEEEEEEKDEKKEGKDTPLVFKAGLPVRKLGKQVSAVEFDVRLSEHNKAALPDLKPEVRKQLGK